MRLSYKKTCKFLNAKSNLKVTDILKDMFVTEDLTLFCRKIISLSKFVQRPIFFIYVNSGKIRMKKVAQKTALQFNLHNQDRGLLLLIEKRKLNFKNLEVGNENLKIFMV